MPDPGIVTRIGYGTVRGSAFGADADMLVVGNAYVDDFLTVTVRELLIDSVTGHIITETGEDMTVLLDFVHCCSYLLKYIFLWQN